MDTKLNLMSTVIFGVFLLYSLIYYSGVKYCQTPKVMPIKHEISSHSRNTNPSVNVMDTHRTNITKILLYTCKRCGSSFTGELFKQNPKAFYTFEPLMLTGLNKESQVWKFAKDYTKLHMTWYLKYALDCNFTELYQDSEVFYPNDPKRLQWTFRMFNKVINRHHIEHLKSQDTLLTTITDVCKTYSVRAIKIIRATNLESIMELVNQEVFILNLVRHPIASAFSRLKLEKSNSSPSDFTIFKQETLNNCKQYASDLLLMKHISQNPEEWGYFDRSYRLIRYEDLSYHPITFGKIIYDYLKMDWSANVSEWLEKSTKGTETSANKPYSTVRNSKETTEHWRMEVSYGEAISLDQMCRSEGRGEVLSMLGYKDMSTVSEMDYRDMDKSLVGEVDANLPFVLRVPTVPFFIHL